MPKIIAARHGIGVVAAAFATLMGSVPTRAAPQATVLTVHPENFAQKWDKGPWRVWALSGHTCLSFYQESRTSQNAFWGFRQSPGSRVDFIVGGPDVVRQGTVETDLNDGGRFRQNASVEDFGGYDSYVISFEADALSIFHDTMSFDVFVDGTQVAYGLVSHEMRDLEKVMAKCLAWQDGH